MTQTYYILYRTLWTNGLLSMSVYNLQERINVRRINNNVVSTLNFDSTFNSYILKLTLNFFFYLRNYIFLNIR